MSAPRLMAVVAHPDDESLGFGGTLAKYAAEGVEVFVLTATRGDAGRYRGHPPGATRTPAPPRLAGIREAELRAAAAVLGVREVELLDYHDQQLDRAAPGEVIAGIAAAPPAHPSGRGRDVRARRRLRASRPRRHLAVHHRGDRGRGRRSPRRRVDAGGPPHTVSKLYYLAWPASTWAAFEAAFHRLISTVDGLERQATPWPEWAITTVIDTRAVWSTAWQAISCHVSQVTAYERLRDLAPDHHEALWGWQSFYRVFSTVNGGRTRETDLFEGIQPMTRRHAPLAMDSRHLPHPGASPRGPGGGPARGDCRVVR